MGQTSLHGLKEDRKVILRGRDLEIDVSLKEVDELKRKKQELIREVRKLGRVFFSLKKSKSALESSVDDYTASRFTALDFIAREFSDEVKQQNQKNADKTLKLNSREKILDKKEEELDDKLLKITEKEEMVDFLNREVTEQRKVVANKIKEITQIGQKLASRLHESDSKVSESRKMYEDTLNKVNKFVSEVDNEWNLIKKAKTLLDLENKKLDARKQRLDQIDVELSERRKWVRDRESTVRLLIASYKINEDDLS